MESGILNVISLFFVLATAMASAANPGVKMRLTEKGIAYVNSVAEAAIHRQLQVLNIPDQSGKNGHLEWSLKNIHTQSISGPVSQITLSPAQSGLTWSLSSFSINLRADWHVRYKQGWVKISDGGSIDVSLGDVSVTVTVGFGQKDGRPSIHSMNCVDLIGRVSVHFHGGSAFIWNLFKDIVEDKIKEQLQGQLCDIVNKAVNVDAEEALSKMKVYIEIDHCFQLDYSLVAAPSVTGSYIETFNKGEVYWKADRQESPFSPSTIPPSADMSKMFYLWLTEYTANTFAYVAQNHGYLKYNITKENLPKNHSSYLNTTCAETEMCIGQFFPQIGKMYPDSWVELRVNSTAVPAVKITTENLTASAFADVEFVAHTPDGSTPSLLTINVNLSLTGHASIVNEKLTASIVGYKLDVSVLHSNIGQVNARSLKILIDGALNFVVIPEFNKIGKAGIDLPVTGDIQFQNAELHLLDGALMISTDVEYTKNLRFVPEVHY